MAKILILDDDQDYCEELSFALGREGHDVLCATTAQGAIATGSLFRPDVLVTDWMLRDRIDGLAVAEVLEILNSALQVVLITGFASTDLRCNAKYQEVFAFIEKPFQLGQIRRTVQEALNQPKPAQDCVPIGVLEVDSTGEIIFANRPARKLLSLDQGARPSTISSVLRLVGDVPFAAAEQRWIGAVSSDGLTKMNLRCRRYNDVDSSLVLLLAQENASYMYDPLVYHLLGLHPVGPHALTVEGHLLIIDSFEQTRRVAAELLREYNCVCHTAQTHAEGWRLFEKDPEIRHVILNFEMSRTKPIDFIRKLKKARPDIRIIGTSSYGDRAEYVELGVVDFLPNPWSDEDLIQLVGAKPSTAGGM
ncbi:MAG: response regulator [Bdellovibrionales bacterium]|nr:response regulator [Bdellovibrionales bacterium]